jgi:hypothetical protein
MLYQEHNQELVNIAHYKHMFNVVPPSDGGSNV